MAQLEPGTKSSSSEAIASSRVLCDKTRALRSGYNALVDESWKMLARSHDLIERINGRFG